MNNISKGIVNSEFQAQKNMYGKAEMEIPIPKLLHWLPNEITKPFYLLMYFSMTIWILEESYNSHNSNFFLQLLLSHS